MCESAVLSILCKSVQFQNKIRRIREDRVFMGSILEGKQHVHMIGIGGSGMYPLAQVLHAKGYYLTG